MPHFSDSPRLYFQSRSRHLFCQSKVTQEIHISLTNSDVEILTSRILSLGSQRSVSVVASLDIVRTGVVMPDFAPSALGFGGSVSGSVSWDASKHRILLEEITFDGECNGDGASCPICLEEFRKGCRAVRTPCDHLFHGECMDKWIKKKKAICPLCRSQLVA